MHPEDHLSEYVLGWLDAAEQLDTEQHLATCPACRAEVKAMREGLLHLAETLPAQVPSAQVWERIQVQLHRDRLRSGGSATYTVPGTDRPDIQLPGNTWTPTTVTAVDPAGATVNPSSAPATSPRRWSWLPLGLAASILLLAVTLGWGVRTERQRQALLADQSTIAGWLTDPAVGVKPLREAGQPVRGTALVRVDGTALILTSGLPPEGQVFQVWGVSQNAQQQKVITSIGIMNGASLQVRWEGYRALWLSVEPAGGSPQPTRTVGRATLL